MRAFWIVLLIILLEVHIYITVSQAKHQQNSSANNAIASLNAPEGKNEDVLEGPIGEVLAQSGTTAVLPCKITDPGAGTITWVRRRDRQLLTVGTSTHSIDKRFVVRHSSTDWQLTIRTVTVDDAGIYECQVTSHPVQRNFARLKITEAYSIIPGAPDLHVKQGSNLRLECQLMAATEKPLYVFWYRQGRMINYDEEPGVDVKLTSSGSILTVNKTKLTHEGNYTCVPSNAKAAFVMVHVIEEEEKPAAMHGGDRRNLSPAILASNFLVSLLAAVSWRIPSFTSLYPT
ncbi:PREDICTED: limbic system-associated membrane protein-like [Trachymyrmex septentrionalis]|uniref:limbic system-associated membrane protein-like n=1 Tax=Trachymyrmex septentrionalis TaxID=34720 RepID=UPI00084F1FBB|nr:PREDICTED: limbic system-associated membrane protein-like [Trachymyrmex septentrionalis]XP_018343221.1 PREDICTED: limbic system-associated membrane protein-like [Trachymyrmex septentrionalis]XP_018343222.1 PREDICTED: limbic system-associated membrane protein-like [Trachymyrmex septentrionalis]XP_018343223.1 PREDICTED: limbic system-associated membrane protein-like [Trachymyrmex septentrionalis]XP_018343224.1 PREDICTED: limbic system-associated membrane protein-like [Trachymyrmex septentriona